MASYIPGDEKKSCMVLAAEMAQVEAEIAKKLPKSDKTGGNILLGAAGCFLIVPWFFMDLKGADKIEVEALQRRYNALSIFAADKRITLCDSGGGYYRFRACNRRSWSRHDAGR